MLGRWWPLVTDASLRLAAGRQGVFGSRQARFEFSTTVTSLIQLRPYQEECIQTCIGALQQGRLRLGVSLPTASGKTTIFSSLIGRIPPRRNNASLGENVLVLVGTIELARQAAARIESMNPELVVEIEQGSQNIATGQADVTVATYQTLVSKDNGRLQQFNPQDYKCIIVDEAHHAAAKSWLKILAHFDPSIQVTAIEQEQADFEDAEIELADETPKIRPVIPIIGFSATFSRHDGFALSAVFDEIVYHKDFVEQIKEGWLSSIRFTTVKANLRLETVQKSSTGDLSAPSLSKAINTDEVNNVIVNAWKEKASDRKTTLVFAVDVSHVNQLAAAFIANGIHAETLTGATPMNQRIRVLEDFKQGRTPVLINCAILTEGADIPSIDCVLLARPTLSRNLFSQMIGRGLRLSPETGKTECLVLDLVNNTSHGLVCSPALFGLDPATNLDAASVDDLEKMATTSTFKPKHVFGKMSAKVAYADLSLADMLDRQSPVTTSLHRLSFNEWIPCSGGIFVLDLFNAGHIRVEKDETRPGFNARYYRPLPGKRYAYARPKFVYSDEPDEDFGRCIRTCDTFASQVRGIHGTWKARGLLRSASWRQKAATTAQVQLLRKRLEDEAILRLLPGSPSFPRTIEKMTSGEASRIFAYLNHGAKGRLQKYDKAVERESLTKSKRRVLKMPS